jgi:hypothetical protein
VVPAKHHEVAEIMEISITKTTSVSLFIIKPPLPVKKPFKLAALAARGDDGVNSCT